MKSKLPIGTKLRYHAAGRGEGTPCEIVGLVEGGRYQVRREDCGRLASDGTRPARITKVSDKTLASKEYVIVEQPPELWMLRHGDSASEFCPREAIMKSLTHVELFEHEVERVYVMSNHGEHETWNRYEGTGKFVKAAA